MYHDVLWQINKERQTELTEMTGGLQLAKGARVYRARRRDRLFANMGNLLVNLGTKLKARYEPATQLGSSLKSSKEPSYLK